MTIHTKNRFAVIAILACGFPPVFANEPDEGGAALTFEMQSTALGALSSHEVYRRGGPGEQAFALARPAYAAGIPFKGPTRYLIRPGSAVAHQFATSASRDDRFSAAQKRLMGATHGLIDSQRRGGPVPQMYRPHDDPNGPELLLLYAATLEDAKAMAEAYVEYLLKRYNSDVEEQKERIVEQERRIIEAEEYLREVENTLETSGPALEAHKKKVPYRTEEEAAEAIAELDRMLNAARVDIAGIKARLAAIQDHLRTGKSPYDEAIKAKLQTMFVEQSIALEGAEARRAMATLLRTDANRFLDLHKSFTAATRNSPSARELPGHRRKELERLQRKLEALMMERPLIAESKIAIYPVEWTGEAGDPIEMGPMN